MYFARRSLIPLLLIGILLASCGQAPAGQPTPDVNGTVAAAAQTIAAAVFETQTALAPTVTLTALPTNTFLPTSTAMALPTLSTPTVFVAQPVYLSPTPTGTYYTATPLSSSLAVGCNNLRLIDSYSSVSGQLTPGQNFTQSWKVENNGTCDWVYLYHLVHASGDRMGGSPPRLGKVIPPGKWTTLSVDLTAPSKDGTYNAAWRFSDQGGTPFGASLPVSITVKKNPDPTNTPNLTQTAAAYTAIADAANQAATAAAAAATAVSAQQTAISAQQTTVAATATAAAATASCAGTQTAGGTCP